MFTLAYYYQSPRDRYISTLSRVREAEIEYNAYLAEKARALEQARIRQFQVQVAYALEQERLQQKRREAQANALGRHVLHAAVLALHARNSSQKIDQRPVALGRKQRVRPRRSEESPQAVLAARDALAHRLTSEHNVEVHDTIRNILSRPPEAQSSKRDTALTAVKKIERTAQKLASKFIFPLQLDFAGTTAPAPADLPHTPRNEPVRGHARALNGLLVQLDAIESRGDAVVRRQRAKVARLVERELESLEKIVEGRWKLQEGRPNERETQKPEGNAEQTQGAANSETSSSQVEVTETMNEAIVVPDKVAEEDAVILGAEEEKAAKSAASSSQAEVTETANEGQATLTVAKEDAPAMIEVEAETTSSQAKGKETANEGPVPDGVAEEEAVIIEAEEEEAWSEVE